MTGYGKAVKELPNKKITVEIKSLNSKQLDLAMRVPTFYREKELDIRSYLAGRIGRGKVDFAMFARRSRQSAWHALTKTRCSSIILNSTT